MAGDDDFDIDIYAEAGNDQQQDGHHDDQEYHDEGQGNGTEEHTDNHQDDEQAQEAHEAPESHEADDTQPRQGVKRKSEEDDRPVDQNATAAIMISELNWWTTDDDIRGWLRQADCESEVKDLTFSEHKVNGKSKGQTYIEFYSPQAATAAKRGVDQISTKEAQPGSKKTTTSYWNPGVNPFRTLPKDAPARVKEQPRAAPTGPYNNDRGGYGGGFRGRGGYGGGRGGGGMNQNFNRNFNNNNNNNMGGGFNNNMGGGFNGPMGGGAGGGGNFGFQGRGNMMGGGGGMRGGANPMRGGRGGNMMGMNPMGGMPMGMPGNMGMGMMNPAMAGFQGMPTNFAGNFNTNFGYGQNQGGDWGNPHGAKRPRPE